ncbi:LysM peptidoglycan-binding domain-containing protein [Halomonas icarae]|uniref:LysM peptidoglycan-binding domain-containing protein n=1 Tax=Halomonas icarae TaxID=2691040 RepID=A0A7X4VZ78_9GAMM|nr:M23 family metallopeptidase [Halomonas icarae]NAW12133.1 LysM peptidoglycan-binding domain-containing protein [Halomonas icarae]
MDQCALATKGRTAFALLIALLLLTGCASRSTDGVTRDAAEASRNGGWVIVQRGDTLGTLAQRAGIPLERLQRFNPGVNARRLAVGQRLLMPTQRERAPYRGPYRYQVRPGDTYSRIARRFGTQASQIQSANPGVRPTQLKVGQLIQVPLSARGTASRSGGSSSSSKPSAPRRASLPDPGALPGSARRWPWPLDDYRIARAYGTDSHGTLQPMLLATERDARAKAVASGEVRYAGSMRQLGKVVIVHHPDNLQSVYALCDRLLVESGQNVNRGEALCTVGHSNATERHDLLFDLRHGGKPVNPRRVLR